MIWEVNPLPNFTISIPKSGPISSSLRSIKIGSRQKKTNNPPKASIIFANRK